MRQMRHGGNVWSGEKPDEWLDFSANLRPEGTPGWVMEAMREALSDTRYYPDPKMTAAREGIAAYAGVSPDCILPAAGGAAAIDLALSCARGAVYVQPVTFGEYAQRAAVHGRAVCTWQDAFSAGDTAVLCNPNNPTGHAYAREEVLAMAEAVRGCGAEMLVDEAFIDFCPVCSVRRDVCPGLAVTGSLTKALCIPGVRLGYICASPEVIAVLERRALPWPVSALASAVAAKLPQHLDEIAADARRNAVRREGLKTALEALGAKVSPSCANFLLADFGRDMTDAAQQLRQRRILVRTCASFGLPESVWRLAVKTQEENMRLAACLEEVLYAR